MKLVTRYCKCNCGKKFRCYPNSPSEYFDRWHKPGADKGREESEYTTRQLFAGPKEAV